MQLLALLLPFVFASASFAEPALDYLHTLQAERQRVAPRQTELLTLPNQLKVFLVSDGQSEKGAVAIRVGAGMYSDPQQYRGLAHYLEHMLFLGSDKYPNADDYDGFVNSVQGESNAFTQGWSTNYYLTVPADALGEGVDRLAQFFIAPKFDEKYLAKELGAIQSEYDKNIEGLGWRLNYLEQQTILPTHPAHWTFQGNMQTLGKIPRSVLLEFYHNFYSANNMMVTIIGPQSLVELKALATAAFAGVPGRGIAPPVYPAVENFRTPIPRLFTAKTEQQTYILEFSYTLPQRAVEGWRTKDLSLVAQLLSDKSEGSFGAGLKNLGWATDIAAWHYTGDPTAAQFGVEVDFTPIGYQHWQEVASSLLVLIEDAKKMGLKAPLFKNAQRSSELDFLYNKSEPADEAVEINQLSQLYPADDAQAMAALAPLSNPLTYQNAIAQLTPSNLNVFLFAPDIQGDKKTDFYELEYREQPLSGESWFAKPEATAGLRLKEPTANIYLPQDLRVLPQQDSAPVVISKTPLVTTQLQRDGQFNRPRAVAVVKYLSGPQVLAAAEDRVLAQLYVDYLNEALERWYFGPSEVGFEYEITPTMRGLNFVFDGYSDRLAPIMREFFQAMKGVTIDPSIFARVLDNSRREAANRSLEDATDQIIWFGDLVWDKSSYTQRTLPVLLETMTVAKLKAFQTRLFQSGRSEVLEYGNLSQAQGLEISQLVERSLAVLPATEVKPRYSAQNALGTSALLLTREGTNNVWMSQYQIGASTPINVARMRVMENLVANEFYNHMRTEKQYGYVVYAWAQERRPHVGLNFLVQSLTPSTELSQEGHRWLKEDFMPMLLTLTDAEYKTIRANLAAATRLKPSGFDETLKPIKSAFLGDTAFDFEAQIASEIEKIPLASVISDFENLVLGSGRRELSLYLNSSADGAVVPPVTAGEAVLPSLEDYWKSTGRW